MFELPCGSSYIYYVYQQIPKSQKLINIPNIEYIINICISILIPTTILTGCFFEKLVGNVESCQYVPSFLDVAVFPNLSSGTYFCLLNGSRNSRKAIGFTKEHSEILNMGDILWF